MDLFNDSTLSAYFPGLVDICINDDGELVYAIVKDGEFAFVTETGALSIPDKDQFKFTIPRAAEVLRHYNLDDATLYDDLLAYLKRFSALDGEQWAIIAHYVFLTYLHDHPGIDYCPYILLHAVPERGKSRIGKSIIYVAFRGIYFAELRQAVIFRYSDYFHGTLFLDLLDVSKKAERGNCEDILLLRYEKGAQCCRVQYPDRGAFNDMAYYHIYGPTIIASNGKPDNILETRCLRINMPNRPGNYENPRPELALELIERLTAWRAKHLSATFASIESIEGISGRLWDITKPLFLVNSLLPVESSILEDSILVIAGEKSESRKDTIEGRLVAIIKEITDEGGLDRFAEWNIRINDIRSKYNEGKPAERQLSASWIGMRLKSMSLHNRKVHGCSEIRITSGEYATLLKQYGFTGRDLSKPVKSLPDPLPEKHEQNQYDWMVVEGGRGFVHEGVHTTFNSPEEREFYLEKMEALEKEGVKSWNYRYRLALEALEEWRKFDYVPL